MKTPEYKAHVGGEWVDAQQSLEVRDPAAWDSVIGLVPALDSATVTAGIEAALAGAKIWAETNAISRGRVLFKTAELLRSQSESLALTLSKENGKTLAEAKGEVAKTADFFEYYAGLSRLPYGDLIHDERPQTTVSTRREPLGVVLAITPWNDPLLTPARKLAPALAAGNAVVLKPASDTPIIALELTRVLLEAGLPPQVITTFTGRASDISHALVSAPEIDAISFTGSTEVGLALHTSVAGRNLRVQCEMGGKNAAIVLADADLDLAAQTIAAAGFAQAGQRCTASSRILVDRTVLEVFVEKLVAIANSMLLGPGTTPETTLGPLVNKSRQTEVLGHIAAATNEGARLRSGGTAGSEETLGEGCFVLPTILDEVTPDMLVWRTEIFGPVVAVLGVDDLDEAIRLANDSEYGLSASLFTRDLGAADRFVCAIDAGQVAVNLPTSGWDIHQPFGGFKLSGSPFKEQGQEALSFYTRTKTCAVRAI